MNVATCPVCRRVFAIEPGSSLPSHSKGLPTGRHPKCPGSGTTAEAARKTLTKRRHRAANAAEAPPEETNT